MDKTNSYTYISGEINLENYFNEFRDVVTKILRDCDKKYTPEFKTRHGICNITELHPPDDITDNIIPCNGFRPNFKHYKVPDCATKLRSLRILQEMGDIRNAVIKRKLTCPGKVYPSECLPKDSSVDLVPLQDYVLSIRVYMPGVHVKFSSARTYSPAVSQEFLCLSSASLVDLRVKIICNADYAFITGDISDNPNQTEHVKASDINKSAMFYFGSAFYIDTRHSESIDYSREIQQRTNITNCNIYKMENTLMSDLNPIQMGNPYLYVHQGICEHLIVITDARILNETDCAKSNKYPIMTSFTRLRVKMCSICQVKSSKFLVMNNPRLPLKVNHFCPICLREFNYVNGTKIGNFQVYKYVDRASLL